eukprot:2648478-Amphidinium_carterae.1
MKLLMLVNQIQGNIRSHLLLNTDMTNLDFSNAAKVVENYYWNVYIDKEFSARTKGLKGKYRKGKDKGKDKTNTQISKVEKAEALHHTAVRTKENPNTVHDPTTLKEKGK